MKSSELKRPCVELGVIARDNHNVSFWQGAIPSCQGFQGVKGDPNSTVMFPLSEIEKPAGGLVVLVG